MAATFKAPRKDAWNLTPEELVLVDDKDHPLYDPRINLPLDENLVKNIMFNGVIEPIVITKVGVQALVVDGRQRVRAAREANKRFEKEGKEQLRITCVLRKGIESDLFGVSVSANEHRQDDTPMGRAQKCARYLAMGRTEAEAAVTFGVTIQCVKNWQRLLDCSTGVRKAVEEGIISASAASELADLAHDEQDASLAQLLYEERVTGEKPTKRKVKRSRGTERTMKTKREITAKLQDAKLTDQYRKALLWVLG